MTLGEQKNVSIHTPKLACNAYERSVDASMQTRPCAKTVCVDIF